MSSPREIATTHLLERIGLALKEQMERRECSIHSLADRAGITPEYLVRILDGKEDDIELKLMVRLAFLLDFQWTIELARAGHVLDTVAVPPAKRGK